MTTKTLNDFIVKKESMDLNPKHKAVELFFRESGEKYGIRVMYANSSMGKAIGLYFEWPEAPENENVLKSSMITDYQFKSFTYPESAFEEPHQIYFLVFKYRDRFYINHVSFTEDNQIKEAGLLAFESKEQMLAATEQELWPDFMIEVKRFVGE